MSKTKNFKHCVFYDDVKVDESDYTRDVGDYEHHGTITTTHNLKSTFSHGARIAYLELYDKKESAYENLAKIKQHDTSLENTDLFLTNHLGTSYKMSTPWNGTTFEHLNEVNVLEVFYDGTTLKY